MLSSSDERLVQKHGRFQDLATSAAPQTMDHAGSDPRDPLKWKQWKKYSFLIIVSSISFLADLAVQADLSLYSHNLRNGNSRFPPSTTLLSAVNS